MCITMFYCTITVLIIIKCIIPCSCYAFRIQDLMKLGKVVKNTKPFNNITLN